MKSIGFFIKKIQTYIFRVCLSLGYTSFKVCYDKRYTLPLLPGKHIWVKDIPTQHWLKDPQNDLRILWPLNQLLKKKRVSSP
jgi:hypothetical protein